MDRFSLLLLEPGEIYFEDFKVVYHIKPEDRVPAVHNEVPGRLKVCSKSVVFVPQNISLPMLKFPLTDCEDIDEWCPRSFQSALASKRELMFVSCRQTVEMLRQNIIAPFKFRRTLDKFVFSFTYRRVSECLGQVQQLHRASSLPPVEQAGMVAAINYSRQSRLSFDTCWLENLSEKIVLETVGNRITPLVLNPGRVLLTNERLYFQPYNNVEVDPVTKVKLLSITGLYCRRYLLRPQGLEIEYSTEKGGKKHIYLSLGKQGDRDKLYNAIIAQGVVSRTDEGVECMTLQWQHGILSNYDYLLHLNSLADRSFNDLTQYPVFPWVIADYTSSSLDLESSDTFRDLSKPIGALNKDRLESLKMRREEMGAATEGGCGSMASYLYGSHYSCPGFVLYYMVRKNPQLMLCLQNGRFDHPDRMFNSLRQTWRNVTTNQSDFKELVPEFYDLDGGGEFLCNAMEIDFGVRHTGERVGDVGLPPWAKNSRDLVEKLRLALESPIVSKNLHSWIDLVFGFKNSGEEAELADNVFYPLCYEGGVDLDKISDPNERYALEVQISEFGQVPKQIFRCGHPQRYTSLPPQVHAKVREDTDNESVMSSDWRKFKSLIRLGDHHTHKEGISALGMVGSLVVSASHDSNLKLYRWREGHAGVERSVNARTITIAAVVSPSPCTVILGCWDNTIIVYGIVTGAWRSTVVAHTDAVSCISWDKGVLSTGSWDGLVKLWSCVAKYSYIVKLTDLTGELDHGSPVTCLTLQMETESNGTLAAGTREGEVVVWSVILGQGSMAHRLPSHSRQVNCVALAPDGSRILSGGSDMGIKVFDLKTGTVVFSKNVGEEVVCLAWDGVLALVGGGLGQLSVWNLAIGKREPESRIIGHTGRVTAMAVGEDDGNIIVATGGEDRRVIVWKAQ